MDKVKMKRVKLYAVQFWPQGGVKLYEKYFLAKEDADAFAAQPYSGSRALERYVPADRVEQCIAEPRLIKTF